jgi:hypothetical protein
MSSEGGPTFACGCRWEHARNGLYQYQEVHSPECVERSRAQRRRYRERAHRRFDQVNTVVFPAVPVVVEGVPADDAPDPINVEFKRPVAIPSLDVSLAMDRVFRTSDHPSPFDWVVVLLWWLRRQRGLLGDDS